MTKPTISSEKLAQEIRQKLVERGLTPEFAKLYSQHTRLSYDQQGLSGWRDEEIGQRLHDAMRLTSAGLFEKELGVDDWKSSLRRAGELLEWLSHAQLNPNSLPLTLLSSAAYQLAGYPARATGLLNTHELTGNQSRILYHFLKADFRNLLQSLSEFWSTIVPDSSVFPLPWHDQTVLSERIHDWIAIETASAIGVICSFMRWGDETRVTLAIEKLSSIADLLLHGTDPYSWLLAKLCAEVARIYYETSTRITLATLTDSMNESGKKVVEAYLRYGYYSTKSLTWRSQKKGIDHLNLSGSFALCTPTGSGKTTVAEVAILQSLYREPVRTIEPVLDNPENPPKQPIALYLVPSRALATEVESKLTKVLSQLSGEKVVVTGLYGGNDWGPTDAWLTADERTVLICTYEKAEALVRFLGLLFLDRVTLIVIDEAHNVQYEGEGHLANLISGESRSLRLESLCARLLTHLDNTRCRILALSAVAVGVETLLSNWVTGTLDSKPVLTSYRSTRQLIGSLDCIPTGKTEIRYALLDNSDLKFPVEGRSDSPFIPNPFPLCPIPADWESGGPEKRIRPHLLWAALHLAQPTKNGQAHAVLIAVMQKVDGYADDFLQLLKSEWRSSNIPNFFTTPTDRKKLELWQLCLASCEDYFTKDSREFELLEMGIVLHHGNMPGLLARLLIQLIDEKIVNIVLATSTLSQGINLPFETVLIPTLRRRGNRITAREFSNLVGRAGRPGFGTEGRSLVLLPAVASGDQEDETTDGAREGYFELIAELSTGKTTDSKSSSPSPLAALLAHIYQAWQDISGSDSRDKFIDWLERTAPIEDRQKNGDDKRLAGAIDSVDSLDAILLAAIVEIEQMKEDEFDLTVLEERLQQIWQKTFARFADESETWLNQIFVKRGLVLRSTIYPTKQRRRQLYRTGLPPSAGELLIQAYHELLPHLRTGEEYAKWTPQQRYQYIETIVLRIRKLPNFMHPKNIDKQKEKKDGKKKDKVAQMETLNFLFESPSEQTEENIDCQDVLRWWLSPRDALIKPKRRKVSDWHDYVSKAFTYRFNWGLGSLISLAMDEAFEGKIYTPSLEDWPSTKLPWSIFWLKEMIIWGTLEPIAAYLLSKRIEVTRSNAEARAREYYHIYENSDIESDDLLNASKIRQWADSLVRLNRTQPTDQWFHKIQVTLLRDFSNVSPKRWRVVPVESNDNCRWLDPAGFPLAMSEKIKDWSHAQLQEYDFWLDPQKRIVTSEVYLS